MATLVGGTSGAVADVDALPKAQRVINYGLDGSPLFPLNNGSYILPVNIRLTAAPVAGSAVLTLRMGTVRTAFITGIKLVSGSDPTTAAATSYNWELVRFSTATPSGGAAIVPVKTRTAYPASGYVDARQNPAAALVVTGVVFETSFLNIQGARVNAAVETQSLSAEVGKSIIEIAPNEGLALRCSVAGAIGDFIAGMISWDER